MVILYIILAVIGAGINAATLVTVLHSNSKLKKLAVGILINSIASCFLALVGTFCPNMVLSRITFSVDYIMADITAIMLILIVDRVDVVVKRKSVFTFIAFVILVADTSLMIANIINPFLFDVEEGILSGIVHNILTLGIPFWFIHLAVYYSLLTVLFIILIRKILLSEKMYRTKYIVTFVATFAAFIMCLTMGRLRVPFECGTMIFGYAINVVISYLLILSGKSESLYLLGLSMNEETNFIICFNKYNECIYFSHKMADMFETKDVKSAAERDFVKWLDGRNPKTLGVQMFEDNHAYGDDERYYYNTRFVPFCDERGRYIGCVFSMYDRTDERQKLVAERERAITDTLTGINNRTGFIEDVLLEISRHPENKKMMIVSNFKDFKMFNKLFGTKAGDDLLVSTARILEASRKGNTVIGRLEADRFAMFIDADRFDERLFVDGMSAICSSVKSDVFRVHMHAGVYTVHDTSMEVSSMCDNAFLALERIKNDYDQHMAYYTESIGEEQSNQKAMLAIFDHSLEDDQFQMFLQPHISADGKLLGAESLVRWINPERGMIPPGEFIHVLETYGQIWKLDRHMWRLAASKLAAWQSQGLGHLHISVNISPIDFYYLDVYASLKAIVEEFEIDPQKLKLEITESAIVNDTQDNIKVLEKLKAYGFEISIDDFGSGYSSLNTLKDLNVDAVKLDLGFLRETEHKERSRIIMKNVIEMSKELGLVVISEGVETEEQVEYLRKTGTDIFQGYFYDKPLPVPAFEEKYLTE